MGNTECDLTNLFLYLKSNVLLQYHEIRIGFSLIKQNPRHSRIKLNLKIQKQRKSEDQEYIN